MFGRRRRERAAADQQAVDAVGGEEFVDDLDEEDRAREDALLLEEIERSEEQVRREPPRPEGPWDVADAPEDEVGRLDLGGLRVPALEGFEVRLDLGPDNEIAAVSLLQGQAAVQLSAFAAPRTEGIAAEVLAEIEQSLAGSGGHVERVEGPHGPEVRATVPTQGPDGQVVLAPVRFVGVDGPRWFLRAVYSGTAAVDPGAAAPLEQAVARVHVVRGTDPMAVRDPLGLQLPPEAAVAPADEDEDDGDPLALAERGPEITETR